MIKKFCSENYNYVFNAENGYFARWGKTLEDNPDYSPAGPEILDLELSTICHRSCSWCYKSNTKSGKNMSLETFKIILDKFPKTLTQVALGIGDVDANPDLWGIMEYCRSKNVVPNITINGERMTPKYYDLLSYLCGAVACSLYDKDTCYNAVNKLALRGMEQVNVHCLLSAETFQVCLDILVDKIFGIDKRLEGLNAIVFLRLKQKGRGHNMHQVTNAQFKFLVDIALANNTRIGFDSCSAPHFLKAIESNKNYKQFEMMTEPCESCCFSYYINVDGIGFPCSFTEGVRSYSGVNILEANNFIKEVWNHEETLKFRNLLLNNHRSCPIYNLQR